MSTSIVNNEQVLAEFAAGLHSFGFALDSHRRRAWYSGIELSLTISEYELLQVFLNSSGAILTREELFDCVLLQPFHPLGRSLDMLISRLRRKLSVADNPGRAIRTVRGAGYVFELSRARPNNIAALVHKPLASTHPSASRTCVKCANEIEFTAHAN
jgi:DNA-binding response OmpR family regulator